MSQNVHIRDDSDGFTITPPLTATGVAALKAFAAAEQPRGRRRWPDSDQCAWTATDDGAFLVPVSGADRDFEEWLEALIRYFLQGDRRAAAAADLAELQRALARVGVPACDDFTQPRTINGRIRVWGEYDGQRVIQVTDNTVTVHTDLDAEDADWG
ncbi:hypothetical protein [Nocardia asiatica]|uniref:hypothetical protein n=1 Tax=Nocardia asiatica TaxID=209252 RepID=UPI0002D3B0D7|nr:hypothetical protein [Nocardia asiatica]